MRKTVRLRYCLAGLALLMAAGIAWLCLPHERLLMAQAHRVTSARGWSVDRGPDACTTYGWLSDREVLFCQGELGSTVALCRRDVRTGRQVSLPALSRCFQKTHADVDGVSISPDRRWIAWYGGADSIVCASVDGSKWSRYPWSFDRCSELFWLGPVGARWIEVENARGKTEGPGSVVRITLHDAYNPDSRVSLPVPAPGRTGDGLPGPVAIESPEGISLIAGSWSPRSSRQFTDTAEITRTNLTRPSDLPRVIPQRLLRRCTVNKLCILPDGKRVAWLVNAEVSSPLADLLHRLIPAVPAPVHTSLQLWVSDTETGAAEEIGHLRSTGQTPDSADLLDRDTLQWLPGGKQLSFVYGEDLYTVSAPDNRAS